MLKPKLAKRLGLILQQERKLSNLSQERLADLAGISAKYLSRLEQGHTNPTIESLEKIAAPLKLELELIAKSKGWVGGEKYDELFRLLQRCNPRILQLLLVITQAVLKWEEEEIVAKELSPQLTASLIEERIKKISEEIQKQGKNDSLEDSLDEVERHIVALSDRGHPEKEIQRLKDLLDEIK